MIKTKHRQIVTEIPNPLDREVINTIAQLESAQSNKELPVVWDRAVDYQIFDRWGNCWIDTTSSIFVTNAGHSSKNNKMMVEQAVSRDLMHAYCYPTVERAKFLSALSDFTPPYLEKFSLVSTGTEASERALKLARLSTVKTNPAKNIIVGGKGNYHGKTMGALMAATDDSARHWIGYQDPNMVQMPFPYPWELEKLNITGKELFSQHLEKLEKDGINIRNICAMIIESYQGWGAVFYPLDYVLEMEKWCRLNDVLLIADEIQSGFGRTGKLFAYEHYNIKPDLVICGKGISGSLPLSAVMGRADLIELDPSLTSTHGGHPVACAGALGNLIDFKELDLINLAEKKGQVFKSLLLELQNKFPEKISRIEGNGMVWAVYFRCSKVDDSLDIRFVDRLVDELLKNGIFSIRTGRGTIKLGPPLTIPEDALSEVAEVLDELIGELISDS